MIVNFWCISIFLQRQEISGNAIDLSNWSSCIDKKSASILYIRKPIFKKTFFFFCSNQSTVSTPTYYIVFYVEVPAAIYIFDTQWWHQLLSVNHNIKRWYFIHQDPKFSTLIIGLTESDWHQLLLLKSLSETKMNIELSQMVTIICSSLASVVCTSEIYVTGHLCPLITRRCIYMII